MELQRVLSAPHWNVPHAHKCCVCVVHTSPHLNRELTINLEVVYLEARLITVEVCATVRDGVWWVAVVGRLWLSEDQLKWMRVDLLAKARC